jgi:hypothetical protein
LWLKDSGGERPKSMRRCIVESCVIEIRRFMGFESIIEDNITL